MNEWRQWWWRWLKECVLSAPSIIHPTNTLIGDCDSPTSSVSSLFCLSRVFFSCQPNWSSLPNASFLTLCLLCNFFLTFANSHITSLQDHNYPSLHPILTIGEQKKSALLQNELGHVKASHSSVIPLTSIRRQTSVLTIFLITSLPPHPILTCSPVRRARTNQHSAFSSRRS